VSPGAAPSASRVAALIRIDAPSGETRITCEKGCAEKVQAFSCNAARCAYRFNQNGYVER
jgi:hypothetical protein